VAEEEGLISAEVEQEPEAAVLAASGVSTPQVSAELVGWVRARAPLQEAPFGPPWAEVEEKVAGWPVRGTPAGTASSGPWALLLAPVPALQAAVAVVVSAAAVEVGPVLPGTAEEEMVVGPCSIRAPTSFEVAGWAVA
jgi:hypothetical protein